MRGVGTDADTTFGILGPLEVRRHGRVVEVSGQRLRTLLGLLALDAGVTVPFDRLTAGVWDDRAPAAVANALQALASRLRTALAKPPPAHPRPDTVPPAHEGVPRTGPVETAGPVAPHAGDGSRDTAARQIVVADPTGYRLAVAPEQVDAHRFTALARSGRSALTAGDARTAAGTLRAALALWRGPALADLAGVSVAAGDIARLDTLWLAATEDRIEADLLLGRHAHVLDDLTALLAEHRLRERLHGQLMRALYGAGRRVEALAAFESARRTFRDELGTAPSPQLTDLHTTLLRDDPPPTPDRERAALAQTPSAAPDAAPHTPPHDRTPASHPDPLPSPDGGTGPVSAPEPPSHLTAGSPPASRPEPPSHLTAGSHPGSRPEPPAHPGPARALTDPSPTAGPEPFPSSAVPPHPQRSGDGTLSPRAGNLRARLTSFVGRERDVDHTGELLSGHRLVTVLGPGGAGKTRLAMEAAEAMGDAMPDGVWLAELAAATDAAGVTQSLIGALDVRDGISAAPSLGAAPLEPVDRLVRALHGKRLLVVLDNCEHVAEHAAFLAERVLAECPGVKILATSREPLGITGEITWILPPLAVPPAGAGAAQAADYPAVRLFADRAAAVRPGYRVDDDAAAVMSICRALDGLPLAIELAAARLRSMTAEQLAARLGDRFRLLNGGSRTAQPRHRTLRSLVEWSWELLGDDERVLGRRLAAFAGGATLETLEQVFGDVLDPLSRLVDKSLVVYDAGRYRMLETIRAYAAERLTESGEEGAVRQEHARHFTGLAEAAEPVLRTAAQLDGLGRLTAEHENLSAALRWSLDRGEPELALRLVGALGWYWWLKGHRLEGATRAREVLAATPGSDPGLRALALAVHGINAVGAAMTLEESRDSMRELRRLLGSVREAHPIVAMAVPSLVLYGVEEPGDDRHIDEMVRHTDRWASATGLIFRALLHYAAGRIEESGRDSREAFERYRETGDRWGMGTALGTLSDVHLLRGEAEQSVRVMREALRLMDELGAVEDTAYMRARLALALNLLGRWAEADSLLGEAEHIVTTLGDGVGEAGVRGAWGEFARHRGDLESARRYYAQALALMDDLVATPPQMVSAVNSSLALLAVQEGDLPRARRMAVRALRQAEGARDAQALGSAVIVCAGLALAEGRAEEGATLLGGAQAIRGTTAVVEWDHVRIVEDAEAALGGSGLAHHLERGRKLDRADVVALALGV
ncbi:BTAD domain-containing putative transcriptional regulator [Nonomuraea muscovyensis]|uniref:AfsR/SARP family transcriptional regulator n=1 Tax=Nonomuraea muscovyensis TaxID=1124761 RepID=UPI0033DA6DF1